MARSQLSILPLAHFDGLELPCYKSKEAAGLDLQAANPHSEAVILKANGGRALVPPTGFCMALDMGFEAQVRPPRSGLALKHGVTLLNTREPSIPIIAAR